MAQIPVEVWHINKELISRLRSEGTEESRRLLRQLDTREFFSNALSYLFSIFLALTVFIIITLFNNPHNPPGAYFGPVGTIALAILSFWGSDKLKDSSTALLVSYYKKKQTVNKPKGTIEKGDKK